MIIKKSFAKQVILRLPGKNGNITVGERRGSKIFIMREYSVHGDLEFWISQVEALISVGSVVIVSYFHPKKGSVKVYLNSGRDLNNNKIWNY